MHEARAKARKIKTLINYASFYGLPTSSSIFSRSRPYNWYSFTMKNSSFAATFLGITLFVAVLGAVALLSLSPMQQSASSTRSSNLVRRYLQSLTFAGDNGSPSSVFPLGMCEGDCDSDADCENGLYCFQRSGTEAVPGCGGDTRAHSGKDFCTTRSSSGGGGGSSLVTKGDNGSPSSAFPLGKCQGDCDRDSDCAGNLVCFQRSGTQSVPGCSGSGKRGTDYCVEPGSTGGGVNGGDSGSGFELKMYWEEGYFWQEETFERKWCMRCDSSRPECAAGRGIYITDCARTTSKFELKSTGGGVYSIKLADSNLCLQGSRSGGSSRFITAENCDSGDRRQQWNLTKGSENSRFQIRPVTSPGDCVTQSHHPREGEVLSLADCRIPEAPGDDTSYWVKY